MALRPELVGLSRLAARITRARLGGTGTVGAMCVVVDRAGRVLLVKTSYRRWWGLPGGYGEPGEAPVHTAARETLEETGVALTDVPVEVARRRRGSHLDVLCVARATEADPRPPSTSWEIAASRWVDPTDPGVRLHPVCDAVLSLVPGGLVGATRLAP